VSIQREPPLEDSPVPEQPSIKGSVLVDLIEDLRKLRESGEIPQEDFQRRLRPEDLKALDAPIVPGVWYDVEFYCRSSTLLCDALAGGDPTFLRQRGYERGVKMIEAGLYQQMQYARRVRVQEHSDPRARFEAYGHDMRLLVTLSGSILSFSRWTVEPDPEHDDRYRIVVADAAAYPDALALATEGLIDSLTSSHGMANLWRFERESRDRIVFRMTRSLGTG
jgi:hypothetical protein